MLYIKLTSEHVLLLLFRVYLKDSSDVNILSQKVFCFPQPSKFSIPHN